MIKGIANILVRIILFMLNRIEMQHYYPELFEDIANNHSSEWDFVIKVWAPLIENVFKGSKLVLC